MRSRNITQLLQARHLSDGIRQRWRRVLTASRRPHPYTVDEIEIRADHSAAEAASILRRTNVIIVRGAIPHPENLFEFARDKLVNPNDPGNILMSYISEAADDGLFSTDFWLIRNALTDRVVSIARAYFVGAGFPSDFYLPCNNLLIRHFRPGDDSRKALLVPYHQDGAAFPSACHMLNCWTPIYPEEVGKSSPGVDLAPVAVRHLLEIEPRQDSELYSALEAQRAYIDRYASAAFTPSLNIGDVLIFTGLCLHRTSVASSAQKSRVSAEIRLLAANKSAERFIARKGAAFGRVGDGKISWPKLWCRNGDNISAVSWEEAPFC